ncbi:MAG: cytochrome c, partial [Candidatus Thiodiazotropha sp.]
MKTNPFNMKTSLLAGTALVLSLGGAVSQAGEVEKAVEYRQGAMEVYSWNMKGMGDMMKGEKPYDAARLAVMAKDLETATQLDLLSGFPSDSESDDSDALPDIWLDFDDFKSKYEDLRMAAKALRCQPGKAKRRLVVPGSREAILETRRAVGA